MTPNTSPTNPDALPPSPTRHVETSANLPGKSIEVIQGIYYIIVGLCVALGIQFFSAVVRPEPDLTGYWVVRAVGLAGAVFGAFLLASGLGRRSPFISGGIALWVALAVLLLEVSAVMMEALPATFLLDAMMQLGFVIWWALLMVSRMDRGIRRTTTLPSRY